MKFFERRGLIFLIYLCLALSLYPEVVAGAMTFAKRDIQFFYFPVWHHAVDSLRAGHLPLWDPYTAFGVPFLANIQACVFYPPTLLFHLGGFTHMFNLYVLLHVTLAGFFMYLWMREWGVRGDAAFISGAAFALTGCLLSSISLTVVLASSAYFPLVMICLRRATLYRGWRWKAFTGLALALQYLAGDASIFLATVFVLAAYLMWERKFLALFQIAAVFAGVTAAQLLPAAEFILLSDRAGAGSAGPLQWSLPPGDLAGFIVPFFSELSVYVRDFASRQSFFETIYAGATVMVLALFSLTGPSRRPVRLHALLAVCGTALAFGTAIPFYGEMHHWLPIFNIVRFPARFIFISAFSVAALAGFGWDAAAGRGFDRTRPFAAAVMAICAAGLWLYTAHFDAWNDALYGRLLKSAEAGTAPVYFSKANLLNAVYSVGANVRRSLGAGALIGAVLWLVSCRALRRSLAASCCIVLVLADLRLANAVEPTVPASAFYAPTAVTRALRSDAGLFRVTPSPAFLKADWFVPKRLPAEWRDLYLLQRFQNRFFANTPLYFGLFDVFGYGFAGLKNVSVVTGRLLSVGDLSSDRLFDLLNIRYLSSPQGSLEPHFGLVVPSEQGNLFKNRTELTRAFLCENAVHEPDDGRVLDALTAPGAPVDKTVYLASRVRERAAAGPLTADERVQIVHYGPEHVRMKVTSRGRYLFFSDSYYPGWRASIDGKNVPIHRADVAFRAVWVDAGEHTVDWNYDPWSVKAGFAISALSLLAIAAAFIRTRGRA